MERIICLVIGYICGLCQTGYIYGRMKHIDIRQHGSGNSGSTNALRVLGIKAGIIVFFGDFLKTWIPCMLLRLVFKDQQDMLYLMILYLGLGVIIGHNYPFYLKFRGGKGIAATAGLIAATDVRIMILCLIVFIVVVAVTRYVSLGSLLVAVIFLSGMIYYGGHGAYRLGSRYLYEFYIMAAVICAMAFLRHRANLVRLLHGEENKVGVKKDRGE